MASESPLLERIQAICLSFPEAIQRFTFDSETFRVREKIFAMFSAEGDTGNVWVKGRPGDQEMLIAADPARFFKPPYLGPKGWIGIHLNADTDWDEVSYLIDTSYRLIAPKKLTAQLPERG